MRAQSVSVFASFSGGCLVSALALALAGASVGCGSDAPAAFPQHLDIPVAPTASPSQARAGPEPRPPAPPAPAAPKDDPSHPPVEALTVSPAAAAIVAAADRADDDRALDAGRHPGELLTFLDLSPGMHVAEVVAGTGYTTELLARAVGAKGKVWAENPPDFLKFVGAPYKERLAKPVMKSVVRADREIASPFPADVKNLDAVVSVLVYHDTVWLGIDRDKMNKAVFDALKKGGEYVVVDHSAAEGHGLDDVKTFHRIEEATVTREVLQAGFERATGANFLRNPEDARDWNDSPKVAAERRGTSDRFVLKFVKP
jgi:predicted methyltransferase